MMSKPNLTEAMIRSLASDESFSRGKDYYNGGAVISLDKRDNTLIAQVEGSSYKPYDVTIELDETGVVEADCNCPYDWGGYCKHIVAVLLAYIHEPQRVAERRSADELLADLGRDDLLGLLTDLLEAEPHLIEWVEMRLETQSASAGRAQAGQPRGRKTPLDPTPFRKQAQYIMGSLGGLRPSEAYWKIGGMVDQMRNLVDQAKPFIEAGNGGNALVILDAVTQVYIDLWLEYDDSDGELGGLFDDLGSLFTEAILSADLSPKDRKEWVGKMTNWQDEISDYGIEDAFSAAIGAARQGWDYKPLQAALQGRVTDEEDWEEEESRYDDELVVARLNVLERQGRMTEYLNLAKARGQTGLYAIMLVKLGRSEEAINYALQHVTTTGEALALAVALRQHNHSLDALKIAERGLTLGGERLPLARWLRDTALQVAQPTTALQAARVAFANSLSLDDYQKAEVTAGEGWPSVKPEFLNLLASADFAPGKIDIYLHEGEIDKAIKAVDGSSYLGYDALERVVDAALGSHPDWAIRQCKKQAESIMDGGKSSYYHHALRWLGKAKGGYVAANRGDEWRAYLEGLISKHVRKYSLRPGLEALRE
jgi:uncharacterized Zn finger protein